MGVEDYRSQDAHRHISAVRNFYSGILLLAKEVLVRKFPEADPDILLASKIKPFVGSTGSVAFGPDGKVTIDFDTIGKRFKDFGIPLDHGSLKGLNSLRNDLEHKYSNAPRTAIIEAIAKGFPVAVQLFKLIDENPAHLLEDSWQAMLETSEVYAIELRDCRVSLALVRWYSDIVAEQHLSCSECGSDLVQQANRLNVRQADIELSCRACGESLDAALVIAEAVDEALSFDAYTRKKETGEDGPVFDCPECGYATYIESEAGCAFCACSIDSQECLVCGARIPLAERLADPDGSLCSYHQYVVDKERDR